MCSFKCLRSGMFLVIILNILFFLIMPIVLISLLATNDFFQTTGVVAAGASIAGATMIFFCLSNVQGWFGVLKLDKYCMIVNTVFICITAFAVFILLAVMGGLSANMEDQLQKMCDGGAIYSFRGLERYDDMIRNLGSEDNFCGINCLC